MPPREVVLFAPGVDACLVLNEYGECTAQRAHVSSRRLRRLPCARLDQDDDDPDFLLVTSDGGVGLYWPAADAYRAVDAAWREVGRETSETLKWVMTGNVVCAVSPSILSWVAYRDVSGRVLGSRAPARLLGVAALASHGGAWTCRVGSEDEEDRWRWHRIDVPADQSDDSLGLFAKGGAPRRVEALALTPSRRVAVCARATDCLVVHADSETILRTIEISKGPWRLLQCSEESAFLLSSMGDALRVDLERGGSPESLGRLDSAEEAEMRVREPFFVAWHTSEAVHVWRGEGPLKRRGFRRGNDREDETLARALRARLDASGRVADRLALDREADARLARRLRVAAQRLGSGSPLPVSYAAFHEDLRLPTRQEEEEEEEEAGGRLRVLRARVEADGRTLRARVERSPLSNLKKIGRSVGLVLTRGDPDRVCLGGSRALSPRVAEVWTDLGGPLPAAPLRFGLLTTSDEEGWTRVERPELLVELIGSSVSVRILNNPVDEWDPDETTRDLQEASVDPLPRRVAALVAALETELERPEEWAETHLRSDESFANLMETLMDSSS